MKYNVDDLSIKIKEQIEKQHSIGNEIIKALIPKIIKYQFMEDIKYAYGIKILFLDDIDDVMFIVKSKKDKDE